MRNTNSIKKVITLAILLSVSLLFYFYTGVNSTVLASTSIIGIKEEKGMTVEEFKKRVSNKNKVILVYLYADWCAPCINLKSEILALENETKEYCEILKINSDENPLIAEHFEINSLPMFVIYKNGNKSWENIGLLTKLQIKSKLELYK